jgi:hypothetical protein
MKGHCQTPEAERADNGQPFPARGLLADNLNSPLALLRRISPPLLRRPAYVYILTTLSVRKDAYVQRGSAPNFQGGAISLCTCKHKDRSSPPPVGCRGPIADDPWQGIWVAGLCSPSQLRPRGLFYLMLVDRTFASHAACWHGLGRPLAKSAYRSPFGDIYEPIERAGHHAWSELSYRPHRRDHVHNPLARKKDIEVSYYGRYPRLLVGVPRLSYLWSAPHITLDEVSDSNWRSAHHRFFPHLRTFLETLR